MCSVSMVTDDWMKRNDAPNFPNWTFVNAGPSREEFQRLKAEVEALKVELKKAREQDIQDNAPDCEMKESVEILRKLAQQLGVDLEDIFDGHK